MVTEECLVYLTLWKDKLVEKKWMINKKSEIFCKYVVHDADFKSYNRRYQLLRNGSVEGQEIQIKSSKKRQSAWKIIFFENLPKWVFRYAELKFANRFRRLLSYRLVTEVTPF
jgi:hypothetical protein